MRYNLSKLSPSIRNQIENNAQLTRFFGEFPQSMLSLDKNAKTVKGRKDGYATAILYLLSSDQSGVNVCPMAKVAQCDLPCLVSAGRGRMNSVYYARLRKTLFWAEYQDKAIALIKKDIERLEKKAKSLGLRLAVRLNGTSDIRFENYGIIQAYPHIQFYDYTKLANRKNIPDNYDLTYSYSGALPYQEYVNMVLEGPMRIAVVFRSKQDVQALIDNNIKYLGRTVIDGDRTDLRFLEPDNVIVALYAKGSAKYDGSGFVVDIPQEIKKSLEIQRFAA